jgi:hypothetical protein
MFLFYHTTLVALFVSLTNGFNRLFNHQLVKKTKSEFITEGNSIIEKFSIPLPNSKKHLTFIIFVL